MKPEETTREHQDCHLAKSTSLTREEYDLLVDGVDTHYECPLCDFECDYTQEFEDHKFDHLWTDLVKRNKKMNRDQCICDYCIYADFFHIKPHECKDKCPQHTTEELL